MTDLNVDQHTDLCLTGEGQTEGLSIAPTITDLLQTRFCYAYDANLQHDVENGFSTNSLRRCTRGNKMAHIVLLLHFVKLMRYSCTMLQQIEK